MSNTPTFTEIFARINEASQQNSQLNELFGGLGSTLARKAVNAVRPTSYGAGQRLIEVQAKNVLKAFQTYRGTSGLPGNARTLKNWIYNVLGESDKTIWINAADSFGQKYGGHADAQIQKDSTPMDLNEIRNLIVEFIKARNAREAFGQDDEKINKTIQPEKPYQATGPMRHPNKPLGAQISDTEAGNKSV